MADSEDDKTTSEEENSNEDEKDESEDESQGEESGDEEEGEEKDKEKEEEKKADDKEIDPEQIEIPVRNAEKKEEAAAPPAGEKDEDEIDPDDEKTIGKVVDKKVAGLTEQLKAVRKLQDETEVNSYITAHPEFVKYRGAMLKYMRHEAYSNIPVANIAAIVASSDLQKIGAQKEREATKKANDTKNTGSTARKAEGGKTNWLTASPEEYQQQRAKVLQRQGV